MIGPLVTPSPCVITPQIFTRPTPSHLTPSRRRRKVIPTFNFPVVQTKIRPHVCLTAWTRRLRVWEGRILEKTVILPCDSPGCCCPWHRITSVPNCVQILDIGRRVSDECFYFRPSLCFLTSYFGYSSNIQFKMHNWTGDILLHGELISYFPGESFVI